MESQREEPQNRVLTDVASILAAFVTAGGSSFAEFEIIILVVVVLVASSLFLLDRTASRNTSCTFASFLAFAIDDGGDRDGGTRDAADTGR